MLNAQPETHWPHLLLYTVTQSCRNADHPLLLLHNHHIRAALSGRLRKAACSLGEGLAMLLSQIPHRLHSVVNVWAGPCVARVPCKQGVLTNEAKNVPAMSED